MFLIQREVAVSSPRPFIAECTSLLLLLQVLLYVHRDHRAIREGERGQDIHLVHLTQLLGSVHRSTSVLRELSLVEGAEADHTAHLIG